MSQPVSGSALDQWSALYDAAPLRPESLPGPRLRDALAEVTLVAASDLRRARDSALRAVPRLAPLLDSLYREAPLPVMRRVPVVMQARRWSVLARVAWYFGASAGGESLRDVRRRARAAADALIAFAAGHPVIVLFAHGMFNRFLARALLHKGWRGPRSPASAYWGFSVYRSDGLSAPAGVAARDRREPTGPRRRKYG